MSIRYRGGYKYVLVQDAMEEIYIRGYACANHFINLEPDGIMTIRRGYAWDGPSGPTLDDRSNMRGSLFHDAVYQLIREELLPPECQYAADKMLRNMCREDGMSAFRAWYYFEGVHWFGKNSCHPGNIAHPVMEAP